MSFKKLALILIACSLMSALHLNAAIAKVVNAKNYKIEFQLECLEKTIFADRTYWTAIRTLDKHGSNNSSWQGDYFLHLINKVRVRRPGENWKITENLGGKAWTKWKIVVHGIPLKITKSTF